MSPRTLILEANADAVRRAAAVIREGGLVAFPTETVYGLGADALSAAAVARIFEAKERPRGNPLIVHVAGLEGLGRVAAEVPDRARELAARFWPGPLTLVLPRARAVPLITTGGLDTVAVRVPAHPVALALIGEAGCPVAAPSANRSGRPSPTIAGDVLEDLDGRVDLILDGGPTTVGVESTVLDMTIEPPTLLRPGGVTIEQLEACLGRVRRPDAHDEARGRSPGLRFRHYSPRARVMVIDAGTGEQAAAAWLETGRLAGLMAQRPVALERPGLVVKTMPADLEGYAHDLFRTLRELDAMGVEVIFVEAIAEEGLGAAIMDRVRRAAS
jgi:L-threonylcarbamoyladenylate synthase